ncbi:MAG: type I restriction enzyme HsdR N-terminal domain-containing protein [Candidatus Kapabacteria bacterium]|nr:type I restriction enzyme HsdR N-terminal domain-containing protein [Candidatus Kapabacteria bacterium]
MPAKVQTQDGRVTIYDAVRRIRVALTPEEWVRQHCIHWLTEHRHYPIGRCSVERTITGTGQRYDVMVVDAAMQPFLLVECKSYDVKVTPETMRQSAWYNLTLQAPYILLTNGRVAYCAAVNAEGETTLLDDIPGYPTVS